MLVLKLIHVGKEAPGAINWSNVHKTERGFDASSSLTITPGSTSEDKVGLKTNFVFSGSIAPDQCATCRHETYRRVSARKT